jgi:hypothetical protein
VAMDLDDGSIDHSVFHVWRVGAGLEKPGENVRFDRKRDFPRTLTPPFGV